MGQTSHEIEAQMKAAQKDLSTNLRNLQEKVVKAANWKHQFRSNPLIMIGVAFGGGLALAAMFGGRRNRRIGT